MSNLTDIKNSSDNINLLEQSAENNKKITRYNLHENGEGKEINLEETFYSFQRAAENGEVNAMNSLALLYYNGKGTEKNLEKAFYWFQKAAAEHGK
jgi:TPR repeat protein